MYKNYKDIINDSLLVEHGDIKRALIRAKIILEALSIEYSVESLTLDIKAASSKIIHQISKLPKKSNELRINAIELSSQGRLGLTFCPGKKGPSQHGYYWDRNLSNDLKAINEWQPDLVISLLQDYEFELLGVKDLPNYMSKADFIWHQIPVYDVSPPGIEFDAVWPFIGAQALDLLKSGGKVLLHCRGGIGRTGTVAAILLCMLGYEPQEAIDVVRDCRKGTIETNQQEQYVLERGSTWAKQF